jgi:hypothetical protein
MRNETSSVPFTRSGGQVEFPLTLEPMESVLVVFRREARALPPRLTAKALAAGPAIPVHGGPVPPSQANKPLDASRKATLSPVVGKPFEGTCQLPDGLDLATARVILELDGLVPEEAARVTVNGHNAGGFIGRPLRLEVTRQLKPGANHIRIEPFAPGSARLVILRNDPQTN